MAITELTTFDKVVQQYSTTHNFETTLLHNNNVQISDEPRHAHFFPTESDSDVVEVLRRLKNGTASLYFYMPDNNQSSVTFPATTIPDHFVHAAELDFYYRHLYPKEFDVTAAAVSVMLGTTFVDTGIVLPVSAKAEWIDIAVGKKWNRLLLADVLGVTAPSTGDAPSDTNSFQVDFGQGNLINVSRGAAAANGDINLFMAVVNGTLNASIRMKGYRKRLI